MASSWQRDEPNTRRVHFGVKGSQWHADYPALVRFWQAAESMGYDSAWVQDHFVAVLADPAQPVLEAMATLAALAANTRRLRLGPMVLSNPLRHPALVAKMAATLDVVSGGRLELGMGAGNWRPDFDGYGITFDDAPTRVRQMGEAIQVIKLLWTERKADFRGRFYTLSDALCEPKPLQKAHPPIWIGGEGEQLTLRMVALHADGWNVGFPPLPALRHKCKVLEEHCQKVGRDPASIRKSLQVYVAVDKDERAASRRAEAITTRRRGAGPAQALPVLAGTPDACIDQLKPYIDLGFTHVILVFDYPFDLRELQLIADTVLPAFA